MSIDCHVYAFSLVIVHVAIITFEIHDIVIIYTIARWYYTIIAIVIKLISQISDDSIAICIHVIVYVV